MRCAGTGKKQCWPREAYCLPTQYGKGEEEALFWEVREGALSRTHKKSEESKMQNGDDFFFAHTRRLRSLA